MEWIQFIPDSLFELIGTIVTIVIMIVAKKFADLLGVELTKQELEFTRQICRSSAEFIEEKLKGESGNVKLEQAALEAKKRVDDLSLKTISKDRPLIKAAKKTLTDIPKIKNMITEILPTTAFRKKF